MNVLEFIYTWSEHEGSPTKDGLIHFNEKENLPYIRKNVAGKGKYRLLDTHIVESLKARGWIEETKQGRNKVISLTAEGESAQQAYRWMSDQTVDWDVHREEGLDDDVDE